MNGDKISLNVFALDCNNPPGGPNSRARKQFPVREKARLAADKELNDIYKKLLGNLKMIASKLGGLVGALVFSASAGAFPVCGFDVPEGDGLHLHREDGCSVSVQEKKNYAGLDYMTFYDHSGIDKLLSDDTFFIQEDGANYFVSEEADEPKITIKTKHQEAAKPVSFNGMSGIRLERITSSRFYPAGKTGRTAVTH